MSGASDFRSDTVTKPSEGMRAAMFAAPVGDDVLDGDPTVRELEAYAADWLGKDGALFVPSGTMANQVALAASLAPGDELLCERGAHIACWEAGAAAALSGVAFQTFHAPEGEVELAELEAMVRPNSIHCPSTRLVCLEQSFMGSGDGPGGLVLPLEHVRQVSEWARERGLGVHIDGARLANACVAAGVAPRAFADLADTVSICLSKGLGAPVGSLIAGPESFLERARLVRKRLGGWMRQAGILAAAGLYALQNNVERLASDHALAVQLARGLDALDGLRAWPDRTRTNIVMVGVDPPGDGETGEERGRTPDGLTAALEAEGVRVLPMSATSLRFVTHLDVGPADVARCLEAASAACASGR